MPSNLYQLAYMSKSLVEGSDQIVGWELESILEAAQRNNARAGLTGALLYSGGYFCQILEGPDESIRNLIATINDDDRHTDVNVLLHEQITERQFPIWAMAFAGIEQQPRFKVIGMKHDKDRISAKQLGRDMLSELVELVARRELLTNPSPPIGRKLPID